jgi:hypothetical protein
LFKLGQIEKKPDCCRLIPLVDLAYEGEIAFTGVHLKPAVVVRGIIALKLKIFFFFFEKVNFTITLELHY